jgi:hypothetical protein
VRERTKTGFGKVGTIALGSKLRVITREGFAVVTCVGFGASASEFSRQGFATVGGDGYGISEHSVFFTLLGPIYTGHIAQGYVGDDNPGDNGHIADTIAGLVKEEVNV